MLLFVLALLCLPDIGVCLRQKFARQPPDQTASQGEHITLPCRVVNKVGNLQWTRDDFGLGTSRNLTGFDRYTMTGSDDEGDYSLDISSVTLEDDAKFQCQVGASDGVERIRSRYATVTVLVSPDPPVIVQGPALTTTEDREIELECISRGGKPAAEIDWLDGEGNVVNNNVEYFKEPLPDGKRFTARSVLKLTPKKEHHNATFTCQAQNQADRTHKVAAIKLSVKFAPKVKVKVENEKINEFDPVRLTCEAEANPRDVTYKWFLNNELVHGDYTTEFLIPNVTRRLHDAIVKCEVYNTVGKSEESETLEISYGPRFTKRPKNIEADLDSSVTLKCDVDGNPTPEVKWMHSSTMRVLSSSSELSLTVTPETAGKYQCRASVAGFPEIVAEAIMFLKGPPTIKSRNIQYGAVGDTVRIECVAFSVPKPEKVVWTHYGREVDHNDHHFSVLEDPLPDGVRSTLVIRESLSHDFGPYNCSVTNHYGSDVQEIILKKQKSLPLLIILAGVIAGVIVIIAITMVIILCQRRTKKTDELDHSEKQSKQSDRVSNDSDLKVDIRTTSSLSNVNEGDSEQWEEGSEEITPRYHANGGENIYRHSADYAEPSFPPKTDGHSNNGYVPYVDYTRDYNPPPLNASRSSLYSANMASINAIDPRYSATYGNPYLRTSTTSLPPPPHMTAVPNSYTRNGAAPQVSRLPNSPNSQYILPSQTQLKPGTLATHV